MKIMIMKQKSKINKLIKLISKIKSNYKVEIWNIRSTKAYKIEKTVNFS